MGVIPDGNRRWAEQRGLPKEAGYAAGVPPFLEAYRVCRKVGIREVSVYGFTRENTRRPQAQVRAFRDALLAGVEVVKGLDASLLIVGDTNSSIFPKELIPYTRRTRFNRGTMKINVLANYSLSWDLAANGYGGAKGAENPLKTIGSREVSRIDLIVRWGGRTRLSGFLPVQSAYADIFVVDALWPDFEPEHIDAALKWYADQDITRGG